MGVLVKNNHMQDIKPKVSFSKQQGRDYVLAFICAPAVIAVVWLFACAVLLTFGK